MAAETYIKQVLSWIPSASLRERIGLELKGLIAERVERGQSVEEAVRQLGDPEKLAESYVEAVPLHSAPHGLRLAAKLVDGLTVAIVAAAFGISLAMLSEPPVRYFAPMLGIFALAFGFPLVTVIAERRSGQTLGKRLFGLRAVRESGLRLTLGQSFLRQLPLFVQIIWLDALFALFTDRKQRAFELISKTRVIEVDDDANGRKSNVASSAFAMLCVVVLANPSTTTPSLRQRQTAGHGQQVPQRISIHTGQPHQHERVLPIGIREVVGFGRIL
jgi:uncharacterized RDD family membrane protein YckC